MREPTPCAWCGKPVPYKGTGRPPRFCSQNCKQRRYDADDPERKAEHNRRAYLKDRERRVRVQREWNANNKERQAARNRRYYADNKAAWDRYRKARADLFRPEDLTFTTWLKTRARFDYYGWRCWMCGEPLTDLTVTRDHVKPLTVGGRHLPCNIRPACQPCNSQKNNTWPVPTWRARPVADLVKITTAYLEGHGQPV